MGEFPAGAVNRAVSSQGDRVGVTWLGVPHSAIMRHGRWVVQQHCGGEIHQGRVRPVAGMKGISRRSYGAVVVLTFRDFRSQHGGAVQRLSSMGRHGRHPVDVEERTNDTGPSFLCAPQRIYLGYGTGEPGPHGQNWRPPRGCIHSRPAHYCCFFMDVRR